MHKTIKDAIILFCHTSGSMTRRYARLNNVRAKSGKCISYAACEKHHLSIIERLSNAATTCPRRQYHF